MAKFSLKRSNKSYFKDEHEEWVDGEWEKDQTFIYTVYFYATDETHV